MRRTAPLIAVMTAVGLLGAGCADARGDVEAGDCFSTGTAASFDWDTEVSCKRQHTVEVFAVREVSDTPLGQFARAELDQQDGPARRQYLQLLTDFCEPEWSKYTGYDELASSLAPGAVVLPAIYGDMALEATAEPEWAAGNRIVVCYQVLGRPGTEDEQPITVDRPVLSTLAEDPTAVPIEVRDCARSPRGDQGEQPVPCTAEHDREYLGHLNLAQFLGRLPALDQAFLDRFDAATASDEEWAVFDGVCNQIFGGRVSGNQDVSLRAQIYTGDESWGWGQGSYHAACFAETAQQVTSSVLG